jgi:hypothetical protein
VSPAPTTPRSSGRPRRADVGDSSIVVVFKAAGMGRTTVYFAQTRGDAGTQALKALRFRITVT